jgi:Leucine-rich repeat (LRR) protein
VNSLEITHCDLHEIPSLLIGFQPLEYLNMSHNLIPHATFGYIPHFKVLTLSHNKLVSVDKAIELMHDLETLNLDHNALTKIPERIGEVQTLKDLDLALNQLTYFPQAVSILLA